MKECPRCHKMTMHEGRKINRLSRRDGKTYICRTCSYEEAVIDSEGMEPDDIELEFVKTHNRFSGR